MVNAVLSHLEKGQHRHHPRRRKRHHHSRSDSSSSDDEKELLKESGHRRRARIEEVVQEDPSLFGLDSPDTITTSQVLLLAGFFLSLITWAFAYWRTILGGATGDTLVKLAQPNCTPGLGATVVPAHQHAICQLTLLFVFYRKRGATCRLRRRSVRRPLLDDS